MEFVTLVNRSSQVVEGCCDGQRYLIPAHGEKMMLANVAEMVKRQNPIMGTEDPTDSRSIEFLCGVREWGDVVTPIEQSQSIERFDRSLTDGEGQKAKPFTLKGNKGSRVRVALDDDNPVGIQAV